MSGRSTIAYSYEAFLGSDSALESLPDCRGYEDCNDADFLRIDPALRLALGKDHRFGASQSMLSRLENDVLGNGVGLEALDGALTRATEALLKWKNNKRLVIDLDSTEDPAHGKQEGVAYNGHFAKNCFHPFFAFTREGDCLGAKLRPSNVHASDGVLGFVKPIIERYRLCSEGQVCQCYWKNNYIQQIG